MSDRINRLSANLYRWTGQFWQWVCPIETVEYVQPDLVFGGFSGVPLDTIELLRDRHVRFRADNGQAVALPTNECLIFEGRFRIWEGDSYCDGYEIAKAPLVPYGTRIRVEYMTAGDRDD